MNKFILITMSLFLSFAAHAAKPYGPAGCGLGNQLFGKKDSQVLAATTNGSSATQLFGISSGTSNCVDSETSKSAELFIQNNKVQLANDMARGQGEALANLGHVLGCQDQSGFSSALQQNYSNVFPSQERSPEEIRSSVYSVIRSQNLACRI